MARSISLQNLNQMPSHLMGQKVSVEMDGLQSGKQESPGARLSPKKLVRITRESHSELAQAKAHLVGCM